MSMFFFKLDFVIELWCNYLSLIFSYQATATTNQIGEIKQEPLTNDEQYDILSISLVLFATVNKILYKVLRFFIPD